MRSRAENFVVATGFALLATVAVAHSASAADSTRGNVTVVSQTDHSARLVLTAPELPAGAALSPSAVQVTVDGWPAEVSASAAADPAHPLLRRVMVVVDVSGSMAGTGIDGARRSADAFLAAVPPDVQVGLIAFSDRPRVVVSATAGRSAVRAAVARLEPGGETSLYDAVALGLRVLGDSGERSLIVLSDGADTRSRDTAGAVTAALRASGARMDAVAFNTGATVLRTLTAMAGASGGRVTSAADAGGLAAAFRSAAHAFATELTLDVTVPAAARGRAVTVDVTAQTTAGAVEAATTVDVGAQTGAPPASIHAATPPRRGVPWLPLTALFLGLVGLFVFVSFVIDERKSPRSKVKRLLDDYGYDKTAPPAAAAPEQNGVGSSAIVRRALVVADRVAANPERRAKLTLRLSRADVSISPSEWLVIQTLLVGGGGLLGALLFRHLVAAPIVGAVGYLGSSLWLSIKGRRRVRAFEEQLPNSLQMVAGSLRAGFSFAQSLEAVVQEGQEPIAGELHRALAEARLGVELEDGLDGIAERMGSTDFRWVVMAIRIQREVGGNLAEILLNTAGMMRERARLHRQVLALSAEGRLSAYILIALPVLMGLYMFAVRRSYVRPLYTQGLGIGMLVSAVLLVCLGAAWMRKVVKVEV